MSHLERSRDLARRAIAISKKNPEFAERLFEEAKKQYILYKKA